MKKESCGSDYTDKEALSSSVLAIADKREPIGMLNIV